MLHVGSKGFLSDRYGLYVLCETCHAWGTKPSVETGFNLRFSPEVCWEIDSGLALYRVWYTNRLKATKKKGKHGVESMYKTLDDVLGITEEKRRGGWDDQQELVFTGEEYKLAVIANAKKGLPPPDVNAWMAQRRAQEALGEAEEE